MNTRLFIIAASFVLAGLCAAAERPNIVLVLADDLGFSDLGCYGSEIETPNLDALAAKGLRFNQFYNTAKCHSSRVALLTGLYCGQAGNESMKRGATIAEVLRGAGYFTAMSGKWHLEAEPTDRGFERYFGHLSGATNYFKGDQTFRLNGKPWAEFGDDFYTTDADTDFGIRFVDEGLATNKPLFLYLAYNAPHYPLQAPEADVMKYRGKYKAGWDVLRKARYEKQLASGLLDGKTAAFSPRPDYIPAWDSLTDEQKDWEDFRMATFAAMVDRLDRNIGRLVAHLREKGVFENTVFLFCSDNGACPFERTKGKEKPPWDPSTHWTYDTGWAHVGNTPFRWYKQQQHEGGISSPLIVSWPDGLKTKAGSVTPQPGHLVDFMATCLDLAGAKYPATFDGRTLDPLQGLSLVPIFRGETRPPHETLYFHFSDSRALRQGDWKVVSVRGGPWELYNLATDRSELNDLAAKEPDRAAAMSALWHKMAEETDRLPAKLRQPVKEKGKPFQYGQP
jgi:arylsulfatase A-like enzyme